MATEKQIAANRRNSQNNTNHKTRDGKFKFSLNALPHGTCLEQLYKRTNEAKLEPIPLLQVAYADACRYLKTFPQILVVALEQQPE